MYVYRFRIYSINRDHQAALTNSMLGFFWPVVSKMLLLPCNWMQCNTRYSE